MILFNIVKPFAAIPLVFLLITPLFAYDVILKSGKKISGTLIREDAEVLILKDTSGMYHNFKKADIDLEKTAALNKTKSTMPIQTSKRTYTKQDLDRVRQEYDLGQNSFGESSEVDYGEETEEVTGEQSQHLSAFKQTLTESEKPVLVEFWAEWCGPCKKFAPVLDRVTSQYEDELTVLKVNIDQERPIASEYTVRAIPTVLFFKDGELTNRFVGVVSEQILSEQLRSFIEE